MKYIALNKEIVKEIAEKGLEFEGTLTGYLGTSRGTIFRHDSNDETLPIDTGVSFNIVKDDDEIARLVFQLKDMDCYNTSGHEFPVVLSLPLSGREVTLIDSGLVKFSFECSNEMWRKIIERFRKNVERRLDIELGITDLSLLDTEPTFKLFDKTMTRYISTESLLIHYELKVPKDRRDFLVDLYGQNEALFDREKANSRTIKAVNIDTGMFNNSILEVAQYFKPTTKGNE